MLFDNEGYFGNYNEMIYNFPGIDFNKKYHEKLTSEEGFLKGNMFENEYRPYKNYTYMMPKLRTEKEKCLFKIMEASFAINDYALYLDLYPSDEEIFRKYKTWAEKLKKRVNEYEEKYGPLTIDEANYNSYKWILGPWPWESEDSKYV